jgi:hypothetical protein
MDLPARNPSIEIRRRISCFRLIPCLLACLLLWGCAGLNPGQKAATLLPPDAAVWLEPGEQTKPSAAIYDEARSIPRASGTMVVYHVLRHMRKNFSYNRSYSGAMFTRPCTELFERRVLGGCSDYALVELMLLRVMGVPARLVITANLDWIQRYKKDSISMTTGHTYIEAFIGGKWYLVDPTYFELYDDFDLNNSWYPRKQVFCMRGRDFWEMGIRDIEDLDRIMRKLALEFDETYAEPRYLLIYRVPKNVP